jgi:hypothetical protein
MAVKPLSPRSAVGKAGYLGKPITEIITNGFFTVDQQMSLRTIVTILYLFLSGVAIIRRIPDVCNSDLRL